LSTETSREDIFAVLNNKKNT